MDTYFIFGINHSQAKLGTISRFERWGETILDENGTLCTSTDFGLSNYLSVADYVWVF